LTEEEYLGTRNTARGGQWKRLSTRPSEHTSTAAGKERLCAYGFHTTHNPRRLALVTEQPVSPRGAGPSAFWPTPERI